MRLFSIIALVAPLLVQTVTAAPFSWPGSKRTSPFIQGCGFIKTATIGCRDVTDRNTYVSREEHTVGESDRPREEGWGRGGREGMEGGEGREDRKARPGTEDRGGGESRGRQGGGIDEEIFESGEPVRVRLLRYAKRDGDRISPTTQRRSDPYRKRTKAAQDMAYKTGVGRFRNRDMHTLLGTATRNPMTATTVGARHFRTHHPCPHHGSCHRGCGIHGPPTTSVVPETETMTATDIPTGAVTETNIPIETAIETDIPTEAMTETATETDILTETVIETDIPTETEILDLFSIITMTIPPIAQETGMGVNEGEGNTPGAEEDSGSGGGSGNSSMPTDNGTATGTATTYGVEVSWVCAAVAGVAFLMF